MSISSISPASTAYVPVQPQPAVNEPKPQPQDAQPSSPSRQPALAPVAPGVGRIVDLSA
jgi:hypothetical protein